MNKEIRKYDERGNCIYTKCNFLGDYEVWREFNEQNDIIHFKSTLTGTEEWYEYDYKNNIYYFKNNHGGIYYYKRDMDRKGNSLDECISEKEYNRIKDIGKGILLRFELMDI